MRLGRSITSSLDLDQALSAIVNAAVELTGAEEGSLLLLDETSGELYMRASRNFQDEFVHTFRLPVNDSLAGAVLEQKKPLLINEDTPQKIKTSYLVQSLIYVPLLIGERTLGVLGVDNRTQRATFHPHDVSVLSALAEYAVIALENALFHAGALAERNQLDNILAHIQDAVLVVDNNQRLMLANRAARLLLGIGDEHLRQSFADFIANRPGMDRLGQLLSGGETAQAEVQLEGGAYYDARSAALPGIGFAITLHDITALKKLDRIKVDFVNSVSHDLRTPLTSILGYIDLLERAGPVNEMQRDFISRAKNSVRQMARLMDDVLTLGRVEAGVATLRQVVDLNQVVTAAVDGIREIAGEGGIHLAVEVPQSLPALMGDPPYLRQVMDRLLDNALKFTPRGGQITVRVLPGAGELSLVVQDTGMGILPQEMAHIYDRFYRGSNLPADTPGSGLGLAVVRAIVVEGHQGRIEAASTPGEGTTFTITLPAG